MKLKVPKKTLDKAIKAVSKAVPAKGVQPILNNILLRNANGRLTLNATDLDFFIEAIVPSNNEEEGEITLSAKKLEEIVSKLEEDDVCIEVNNESKKTNLICKKASFDLIGVSAEDFPQTEKPLAEHFFSINSNQLKKIIDLVQFSASRYDLNSILSGIYIGFYDSDNILEFTATDGNRLSTFELTFDTNIGSQLNKKEVVIPVKILLDVQKIIEGSIDDEVKIAFLNNQVVFKTEDRFIISRQLDGIYPRYKQLIPDDSSKLAQLDKQELVSCLERVAVMANERTNMVKFSFSDSILEIKTTNLDFGEANDSINIEYMGDPMDIFFNVKYLLESIKSIDSDKIQIAMNESLSPVLIRPIGDEKYLYLIMPIQHKGE